MYDMIAGNVFQELNERLEGEIKFDELTLRLYATDASVYRELPTAVAWPCGKGDLVRIVEFANKHKLPLIPRGAGTSLGGQVVGVGIVVDVSRYMNKILEFNREEGWVRVEPGIGRDELNHFLKPHGLFFSPITSTANRAVIGGMVGNNSCGTNSIVYGTTRDHTLEVEAVLSDGSEVVFKDLDAEEFKNKRNQGNLEGSIYKQLQHELSDPEVIMNINEGFPRSDIHRRNTGYAVDTLLNSEVWSEKGTINLSKLMAGSEGTLALFSSIKLDLDTLPPPHTVVLAVHFTSIRASMEATQIAMKHQPFSCELMDKVILDCTKDNIEQSKNRYFVEGDPAAILLIEFRGEYDEECSQKANILKKELMEAGLGYSFPLIRNQDTTKVWSLRSAGLGLLANIPGDKKAVACIEDTSVSLDDLPDYIDEFTSMMKGFGQEAVYYAHAGAGEIHLRPILNLKVKEDVKQFVDISRATAELVKKYKGSLSGEHGDGRVRASFIPLVMGEENYQLFRRIKETWDPEHIFNPGKIVDAYPMDEDLRYEPGREERSFKTVFSFEKDGGILRAVEKCNGSGDCRKLPLSGGTMCPSYHATRDETHTTRGRANVLREMLTHSQKYNPWDHEELKDVMDLCLSCKGCTSECPSNVDMTTFKAEFLHQYHQSHRHRSRTYLFVYHERINKVMSKLPGFYNFIIKSSPFKWVTSTLGITSKRSLPLLKKTTFRKWYSDNYESLKELFVSDKKVYLFCDEFTNYFDSDTGARAVILLLKLGYDVKIIEHPESGRAAFSKGFLHYAQKIANKQVDVFSDLVSEEAPLIGIEPSAILSFRDEYTRIVSKDRTENATRLSEHSYCFEEFLYKHFMLQSDPASTFNSKDNKILLHGHCHQKSLTDINKVAWLLSLPHNYSVEMIPSGCCGMAGSFGYEEEHFDVSQKISNITLLPAIIEKSSTHKIAASGVSCRHQVHDLASVKAFHTIDLLFDAIDWNEEVLRFIP
ncbi:MAG: FAD-binding oxidoreductase [Saprospiraceae bacterium]|nr:FAD-binding oxidoreductase [Saprospiraceae bacterium]